MSEIKSLEKLRKLKGDVVDYRWGVDFDRAIDELVAEIEREWMRVPVDADGVPIRPREEVSTGMGDNGPIGHLEYWYPNHWVAVIEYKPGQFTRYDPAAIRHIKPRTLEDVLRECVMQSMTVDRVVDGIPVLGIDETMFGDWIAENKDELRELLRGDAE